MLASFGPNRFLEVAVAVIVGDAYRIQRGAMDSMLNDLNGREITGLDIGIFRQGHLREADGAGIGAVGRAEDLDGGPHGVRHVLGAVVGAIGAEAKIDVDEGGLVAAEPARLEGDSAAGRGPVRSVLGGANAAAWKGVSILGSTQFAGRSRMTSRITAGGRAVLTRVLPLHSIGECLVGDEVVPSPARVADDNVGRCHGGHESGQEC